MSLCGPFPRFDRMSAMTGSSGQALGIPDELLRFWRRFRARGPSTIGQAHENQLLDAADGIRILDYAPATDVDIGSPPRSQVDPGSHRYLRVISDDGIPFIKEAPILLLNSQLPKHANLTGGQLAYVGGELWFAADDSVFVSGGSGRYSPIDEEQLKEAVRVFEAYKYAVTSLGWDADNNIARRIYGGTP